MTDVAAPVESSTPAPEAAVVEAPTHNFDPATFTPKQYDVWMEKGTIPKVEGAESATAKATVVAPESATGIAAEPKEKGNRGAEARIRELVAENKALREAQGKTDVKAEPSTAPKEPKVERPKAPKWGETGHESETLEQYESRQQDHVEALVNFKMAEERQANEKRRLEAETAAANKAVEDGWNERRKAAEAKQSDWAEVALSKELPISPVMDGFILDSEVGPEILYHLGSHLDEAKTIAAMSPYKAARALIAIERLIAEPAATPEKKFAAPPITKAAKPATDLKATNGAPVNEVAAAVDANDFARFAELQNAKDIARRKGN